MALDISMPWLRGPDTLGALSAGASAGAVAGRLEQESVNESARLGMEAKRLAQSASMEQARLQQAAEQHQMEFQARQKQLEQNQLREDQRLNIENAYKTAALGIAKGRLEETQKVADEKARAATLAFQREQGFAKAVASGVPVMQAYQQFPVSSALLSSVARTQLKEGEDSRPIIREGGKPILKYNRQTGEMDTLYTPTPQLSSTEILRELRHQRDQLEKASPRSDDEKQLNDDKIRALQYKIDRITHGKFLVESPSGKTQSSKFSYPKVGEVRFGHKFKGGDPEDENNWESVAE